MYSSLTEQNPQALLELKNICVSFIHRDGSKDRILEDINLSVSAGELVVVIGDSGSGKSTLLNVVAGFLRSALPSQSLGARIRSWFEDKEYATEVKGEIYFRGTPWSQCEPRDRNIGLVMQRSNLYRYKSVKENLSFPMEMQGVRRDEREARITSVAELLEITELLHRKPQDLSAGQEQRVAIGKMLLRRPSIALLDEAFANLDQRLRKALRKDIFDSFLHAGDDLANQLDLPKERCALFVTHNHDDAVDAPTIMIFGRSEDNRKNGYPSWVKIKKTSVDEYGITTSAWEQALAEHLVETVKTIEVHPDL